MVCQPTNYTEPEQKTTPVTRSPLGSTFTAAGDTIKDMLNNIDSNIQTIIMNVVFAIIIIVFLIYIFTIFAGYIKKDNR
jgi:hypothetical protein